MFLLARPRLYKERLYRCSYDSNGTLIVSSDNWGDTQRTEIEATGLAPTDPREAAIVRTLSPGDYTAIMAGKNGTIGVGLVEVYKLQ